MIRSFRRRLKVALGVLAVGLAVGLLALALRGGQTPGPDPSTALAYVTKSADPQALPNIVWIVADDMGAGDGSAFGPSAIATPHLERMAAEGALFTDFYASAALCSPSRAGMLTGRYPPRTGITTALLYSRSILGMGQRLLGQTVDGIPQDELLLPALLGRRGYRTAAIGKWHLGDRPPHLPHHLGFHHFYGVKHSNDINPFEVYHNDEVVIPEPVAQDPLTAQFTAEAVRFIESHRGEPFFLMFTHTAPHIPLHAGEHFHHQSEAGRYGDSVEEIDWSVGQILRALADANLDDKTLVLFTSDNGPWYEGSTGGHRGRKFEVFEGGFRVPLIARWPGTVPAGVRVRAPAMNIDLFSTSLDAAGVPPPPDRVIDGRSLLPLLRGEARKVHARLYFFHRTHLWAMREGDFKFHRNHEIAHVNLFPWPKRTHYGPWLFNLALDSEEAYDVRTKHPKVASRLEAAMKRYEERMAEDRRGFQPEKWSASP
jgi:arylsulfatase A-like enzyme